VSARNGKLIFQPGCNELTMNVKVKVKVKREYVNKAGLANPHSSSVSLVGIRLGIRLVDLI